MKPFSDFLDTFDESEYQAYMSDAAQRINEESGITPEQALLNLSGVETLYYLEKYHEWLCKQGVVIVHHRKD